MDEEPSARRRGTRAVLRFGQSFPVATRLVSQPVEQQEARDDIRKDATIVDQRHRYPVDS